MTIIAVDKKGFHKSVVVPNFPPTYSIPWMMAKFSYDYYKSLKPEDMMTVNYSTFRYKNIVEGTDGQVALYEEI